MIHLSENVSGIGVVFQVRLSEDAERMQLMPHCSFGNDKLSGICAAAKAKSAQADTQVAGIHTQDSQCSWCDKRLAVVAAASVDYGPVFLRDFQK